MAHMKPLPKLIFLLLIAGLVVGGGYWALNYTSYGKTVLAPRGKSVSGAGTKLFTSSGGNDVVNVCVVTWGGYAGGQYFNGGFEPTTESRYYKDYGIKVAFTVIEDLVPSREAWKNDKCQVLWTTADSFSTEAGALRAYRPKAFMQADWSDGGDVAVASREISSVNDMRGKKVAFLPASPSHTLLLRMLEAGGLDYSDIIPVTAESAPKAAEMFKAKSVDVGIVWSPDDDDAIRAVPGSKRLTTSRGKKIIADVFYAKESYLQSHQRELKGLVEGWLRGASEINSSSAAKEKAVKILSRGLNQPEDFIRNAINNARLTTYGDNVEFFNLNGDARGVTAEELYSKMAVLYQKLGLAENVPNWREVFDGSILRSIELSGPEHAAESGAKFAKPTAADYAAPAFATKRLSVRFPTGSAVLDDNAKTIIDLGFGSVAKGFAHNRVRVEGNTDDVGTDAVNVPLSKRRAQAVADYLVQQYGFDRNRFVVVGNGSQRAVAGNDTEEGRAKNRRTDFEILN